MTEHSADDVANEVPFAKAVGECFECYCPDDFKDEDTGEWTGEHDDECSREASYDGVLWALGKLRGQWAVVRLEERTDD